METRGAGATLSVAAGPCAAGFSLLEFRWGKITEATRFSATGCVLAAPLFKCDFW